MIFLQEYKTSTDEKIWHKIEKTMSEGIDALSSDDQYHYDRVLEGKYAMITSVIAAEVFMSYHCECEIAQESFSPMFYQLSFQKNSAYTSPINDV